MKTDLTSDLIRDKVLNAARGRRRKRSLIAMASILLPACLAVVVLQPEPETPVMVDSSPAVEEESGFVTITTEQELLDTLAHLDPVIVKREDGTEWLYLTRE